jgi:hypothetical protein
MNEPIILVLAGSQRECIQWADLHKLTNDQYKYVFRKEDYLGHKHFKWAMVGQFYINECYADFVEHSTLYGMKWEPKCL